MSGAEADADRHSDEPWQKAAVLDQVYPRTPMQRRPGEGGGFTAAGVRPPSPWGDVEATTSRGNDRIPTPCCTWPVT